MSANKEGIILNNYERSVPYSAREL